MRILYIEDNEANVALVNRVVNMRGDELHTYSSAEEALQQADIHAFDVILTDINLGEQMMDGLDFTELVRKHGVSVPIVALTAYDFQEYERRSYDVGTDFYVVKPISPQDLVDLLDQLRPSV